MNCAEIRESLSAYSDREGLDAAERAAVEQHLQECASCRAELAGLRSLGEALRGQAEYFRAPDLLRARLARGTARTAAPRATRFFALVPALRYAFAVAAGVVIALTLQLGAPRGADDRIAEEVVAGHVRSLMASHLYDVASTDQHTVKPWFAGKLDFSPPVSDLASLGFPLAGGRLDYVGSHTAAALVYRRHQHVINLFIWPQAGTAVLREERRNGFSLVSWQAEGMKFYAVSDLNAAELAEFARALGATPP